MFKIALLKAYVLVNCLQSVLGDLVNVLPEPNIQSLALKAHGVEDVLYAYDGKSNDRYGESLVQNGQFLAVGAFNNDVHGAVYLYSKLLNATDEWKLVDKLKPPSVVNAKPVLPPLNFGSVLAISTITGSDATTSEFLFISSDDIVPNSKLKNKLPYDGSGSVYVYTLKPNPPRKPSIANTSNFEWIDKKWLFQQQIQPTDSTKRVNFGHTVHASGSLVIIGAQAATKADTGAAYIFKYSSTTSRWVEDVKITPSSEEYTDLGDSIAIVELPKTELETQNMIGVANAIAAVGATIRPNSNSSESSLDALNSEGVVFIFHREINGIWHEEAVIETPKSELTYYNFGYSLALGISTGLISAIDSKGLGVVFSFKRSASIKTYPDANDQASTVEWVTWSLIDILSPAKSSPTFGVSLSLVGNMLAVGSPGNSDYAANVYIFQSSEDESSNWRLVSTIDQSDVAYNAFGNCVSLSVKNNVSKINSNNEDILLIGSPLALSDSDEGNTGAVYIRSIIFDNTASGNGAKTNSHGGIFALSTGAFVACIIAVVIPSATVAAVAVASIRQSEHLHNEQEASSTHNETNEAQAGLESQPNTPASVKRSSIKRSHTSVLDRIGISLFGKKTTSESDGNMNLTSHSVDISRRSDIELAELQPAGGQNPMLMRSFGQDKYQKL